MAGNVQDYELLLKVRADLLDAVKGMKGLSESIGGVSDSAKVAGESADDAAARIKKMVQETSAQIKVVESARSQAERAAQAAKGSAVDYDAQAAAIKRAADATAQYRDRMAGNKGGASSTGAIAAQRAELAKLVGQIDPTVAALARLDAQEAKLNRLRKTGIVGLEDYTRYKNTIDESRVALTSASGAVHKFSLNNSIARREIGYITKDLATGQYGRLSQSALTLASNTGLMSLAFSGVGLAIGGTVAAFAGLAYEMAKGYAEEEKINAAIVNTGNYAGVTVGQIDALAQSMSSATGKTGQARDILTGLIATGKFTGQTLGDVGQAAVNMAEITGKSAEQVVAEFNKFADDPVRAAQTLDDQYHILNTTIYEQIKALQDSGDSFGALQVLAQRFTEETGKNFDELRKHMSWYERFMANFHNNGFSRIADYVKNLGRPATELDKFRDALDKYNKVYGAYKESLTHDSSKGYRDTLFAQSQQAYKELQAAQKAAKDAQDSAAGVGLKKQQDKAAVTADEKLDALQKSVESKADRVKDKIKELNKAYEDLWAGADPNNAKLKGVQRFVGEDGNVSFAGGEYDKLLAGIKAKGPHARKPRSDAAEQRAALAAQQQLIKLLGDEQGALDPLARIYNDYNNQVAKANALAEKAKRAKGANVEAIEAERTAIVQIYATVRDKALAELADKDREAFEKLRDSLRTPTEVKIDTAVKQLKELNGFLTRGTINAKEYNDALKGIGDKVVSKLPTYRGPGAAVGGPFGELQKNFRAQDELDKQYQAQLAALDKFRSTDLAKQKIYDEAKAQLDADYAQKSQVIEQSRQQLTLQSTSDFFGQIAQLQHSQNNKLAAVGKAAAIAQALINTYQSATAAYAALAGIPYVGPALGIAAAAAAIAAGLANVAQIRSVGGGSSGGGGGGIGGGFAKGGYTGHGGKYEPAGVVHKGEVVINSAVVAKPGTRHFLEDVNDHGMEAAMARHFTGYSAGGYVDSPATSTAGFPDFNGPRISPPKAPAGQGQSAGQSVSLRLVNNVDPSLIHDAMSSAAGEQVIINTISRNRSSLKQVLR